MKQEFYNLKIDTNGQRLYEFTDQTLNWIEKNECTKARINPKRNFSYDCLLSP